MNPAVIAALVAAAAGAGKTALNKDQRGDWKNYLINAGSAAAGGAMGGMGAESAGAGAMAGLKAGSLGSGGMMQGGVSMEGMPGQESSIFGGVDKAGGGASDVMMNLLKSLGRQQPNNNIAMQAPRIEAPGPIVMSPLSPQPIPAMPWQPLEPLMARRGRY